MSMIGSKVRKADSFGPETFLPFHPSFSRDASSLSDLDSPSLLECFLDRSFDKLRCDELRSLLPLRSLRSFDEEEEHLEWIFGLVPTAGALDELATVEAICLSSYYLTSRQLSRFDVNFNA